MSDMDIISRVATQYVFERKPPYQEEQIKRAMKEEVEVSYELKRVESEVKKVNSTKSIESYMEPKNEDSPSIDLSGPLDKEELSSKVIKMREEIPNFDNMSTSDKNQVVADIINGKYDKLIFSEKKA